MCSHMALGRAASQAGSSNCWARWHTYVGIINRNNGMEASAGERERSRRREEREKRPTTHTHMPACPWPATTACPLPAHCHCLSTPSLKDINKKKKVRRRFGRPGHHWPIRFQVALPNQLPCPHQNQSPAAACLSAILFSRQVRRLPAHACRIACWVVGGEVGN